MKREGSQEIFSTKTDACGALCEKSEKRQKDAPFGRSAAEGGM
jgi:hypothetical protein